MMILTPWSQKANATQSASHEHSNFKVKWSQEARKKLNQQSNDTVHKHLMCNI